MNEAIKYKTNPIKAIREKCLECCCDQIALVKECPVEKCPIWPFRMGKNPFRAKREMTPEQREAAAQRLKNAREAKQSDE